MEKKREFTKIVRKSCIDCDKICALLCNCSANIVSVKCPDCLINSDKKWKEYNKKIMEDFER